jgi:hypothetical protein
LLFPESFRLLTSHLSIHGLRARSSLAAPIASANSKPRSRPGIFTPIPRRAKDLLREHNRLKVLLGDWETLGKLRAQLTENQSLAGGDDAEMAELAGAEIPEIEQRIAALEEKVRFALLPPDPNEERDAIRRDSRRHGRR